MEEQSKDKPNLIEMAKKRRHLHLVEKLARGKSSTPTLSRTEINELKKYEGDSNSFGTVDTQEKVAKIFGVSTRTVQNWVRDGMPITSQGDYDLIEIRAWKILRNQKHRKKDKKNAIDWEERYREYKARLAEIILKKALGELIPLETIEKELIQIFTAIRQNLLALPNQLAPQLIGLDIRQVSILLTSRIQETISNIADGKVFIEKNIKSKNAKD